MKQNTKMIIFLLTTLSFFTTCLAADFWMKLNWHNETRDIFYTVQNEIYINSVSDDGIWNVFGSKDYGITWDSIPKPPRNTKDRYFSLKYIDNTGNDLIITNAWGDIFIANKDTLEWSYLGTTKSDKYKIMYYHNKCLYSLYWGGVMKSNLEWTKWDSVITTSTVEDFDAFVVDSVGTLYAGSFNTLLNDGGIYRSFDDGDTWEWYPEQFFVSTMGVDSKGRIFAGCYDKIIRSVDNGETWQNILNLSTFPGSMLINSADEIFLGFDEYSAVLFSSDNGETWDNISTGIQGADPIRSMAISPDGYIYLATGAGVYRSVHSTTRIDNSENLISGVELYQNYPNPFNNETNISFSISENAEIDLSVFNTKGEKVKNICNERLDKGFHNYSFKADDVKSGVYFYKLMINGKLSETRKMIYLR